MGGDPFLAVLVGLAALLAVNRLALPRVAHRDVLFVPLVGVNIVLAGYVALIGLPGLEGVGVVRWVVTALLAMHVALAFSERSKARWNAERDALDEERRRAIRGRRAAGGRGPEAGGGRPEAGEETAETGGLED